MAARDRKMVQGSYVYGNTVRAAEPKRETVRPQQPSKHQQTVSRTVRRNQEKALQMDLPYVVMLTFAALCALYICVSYLHVQSSITARMHHIEQMEAELEQLRAENDALETSINTSIDLNKIYEIATKELGMVYAKKDQVLLYDKTESEYVRQYEDIPEH